MATLFFFFFFDDISVCLKTAILSLPAALLYLALSDSPGWESNGLMFRVLLMFTKWSYILVGHIPIRPLSKWHHFPHDDAIAPHVTGRGELPVRDGLWCGPPHWDLSTLREGERDTKCSHWNNRNSWVPKQFIRSTFKLAPVHNTTVLAWIVLIYLYNSLSPTSTKCISSLAAKAWR